MKVKAGVKMDNSAKLLYRYHIVDFFDELEELLDDIDDIDEYEDSMDLCLLEEGIYE